MHLLNEFFTLTFRSIVERFSVIESTHVSKPPFDYIQDIKSNEIYTNEQSILYVLCMYYADRNKRNLIIVRLGTFMEPKHYNKIYNNIVYMERCIHDIQCIHYHCMHGTQYT